VYSFSTRLLELEAPVLSLFVIIFKATEPVQICTAGNCFEVSKALFSVSLAYVSCFLIHVFVERYRFTDKGREGVSEVAAEVVSVGKGRK
jgi:hypothetical protein